jgi:hypothetical protein
VAEAEVVAAEAEAVVVVVVVVEEAGASLEVAARRPPGPSRVTSRPESGDSGRSPRRRSSR